MPQKFVISTVIAGVVVAAIGLGAWAIMTQRPAESSDTTSKQQATAKADTPDDQARAQVDQPSTVVLSLFYVATDDDGRSGESFGCHDSLVMVRGDTVQTSSAVGSAFSALLSNHDREIGQSGLYNALYQSDLTFESATVSGDEVGVSLKGTLRSGGTCDDARILKQLQRTATAASGVGTAKIMVNGTSVEELLGGR